MGATTTSVQSPTLQSELDNAPPNTVPDLLRLVKLGTHLVPQKQTVLQDSATTVKLASPAHAVESVRVTAGAAAAGLRQIGDAGATPSTTVVSLGDDRQTLTFEDGVTGAVIVYTQQVPDGVSMQEDYRNQD